ncbi:class I SAM-dependent methyltransferase [Alsobacter sp. R-9]
MQDHDRSAGVQEAYDRWSRTYDATDNPMVHAATQIIAPLAADAGSLRVLEVGCGTGRNLAAFVAAGAAFVAGCDLSQGMLAAARSRHAGLLLVAADATTALPFADGAADLALFSLVLEHVEDLRPVVAEAARVLRPGGRLVIVEIHPELAGAGVGAHFRDGAALVTMPTYPHRIEHFDAAATAAGLEPVLRRDWRPVDFRPPHPKMAKRDPLMPFTLELVYRRP